MFSRFFIDRPVFAVVLSIFIVLAGLAAMRTLPIAQYPEIAPPVVQVQAFYPGASARVVEQTVAAPLENAINGVSRIVGRASNMWCSDPTEPLPQWIELEFPEPVTVNTVQLTFDTDMNTSHHTIPLVPQSVRDYRLSWSDGTEWHSLAYETGNFQRRRVHRFPSVVAAKLRLTVEATNGDRSARIFEIRAYEE